MADDADVSDGDLVRLAAGGDPVAFRLLVERHQSPVRARARQLCANRSDVDDVAQEAFLRAFIALDRLREPERFGAWLDGIVLNVCRGLHRQAPLTLLPDWPEPLHPAAADGLPSADDLDRADALRTAVAGLPAGQRRAVALRYYADLPADVIGAQSGGQAGAARVSLHKARRRLRAYLTEHRPDLVPAVSRRAPMTAVRIARVEWHNRQPGPMRSPTHVVVLADDAGGRELPVWLLTADGHRLDRILLRAREHPGDHAAGNADELAGQLLAAIGTTVTGISVDELGPGVTAARIELAGPAGTRQVTARLAEGLAIAMTTGAPVRVADEVLARLAGPASPAAAPGGRDHPGGPARIRARSVRLAGGPPRGRPRPRYQLQNPAFAGELDGWLFGGSFAEHVSQSHWHDYACVAENGTAMLSSQVPEPAGFALLGQEVFADDYRGAVVAFRAEFRSAGRAGLFLRVNEGHSISGPLTEQAAFGDPDNNATPIPAARDWTVHEVSARVSDDCGAIVLGVFLAGPGRIELRHPELTRR